MSEFAPIRTWGELQLLDQEDIMAGYQAGFAGADEPGNAFSRSYWHGWRNGRVDAGLAQPDDAQIALITDGRRFGWKTP